MRTVKKNVYYCDFCKKRSLSASHLSKHEKHCTANPDRECGLCESHRTYYDIIEKLKGRYKIIEENQGDLNLISIKVQWTSEPVTIAELLDITDGCPICALSILRLSGMAHYYFDWPEQWYQEEIKNWWKSVDKEDSWN